MASSGDACSRRFHQLVTTSHTCFKNLRRAQHVDPSGPATLRTMNAFLVAEARLIGFIEGVMFDRPAVARTFATKAVQLLTELNQHS